MDTSPRPLVDLPTDLSSLLRRGPVVSVLALLVLVPSQALAADSDQELMSLLRGEVPWAVEAPGAAGSRFGLGLDVFFERQESLRITSLEETIRTRDLSSGLVVEGPRQGDPSLLNRKFDYLFEMEGVGFELPIALPELSLPGALRLYPTLFIQAATADVTFDFLDRTRSQDSTTFEGRGPLFGAGFDLTTALCRRCPWFTGTSYRFQRLPSLDVERIPPFAPQGFEVLHDESRLSRDVHEASARVGYGFSGNRVVSYLGVRYRSTDLEIEDDLRYLDPFREVETTLNSRVQLESETTLALAGVEAYLGGSFYGRIETAASDEDFMALFSVVYLGPGKGVPWPGPGGEPQAEREETREEREREEQRARDIASRIAPRLTAIEAAFLAGWKGLEVVKDPDGQPAYYTQDVDDLLETTEQKIRAVLDRFPELEALKDWVSDEFRDVRAELGLGRSNAAAQVAFAAFSTNVVRLQPRGGTNEKRREDPPLQDAANGPVGTTARLARERRLMVQLNFRKELPPGQELPPEQKLFIYPRYSNKENSPCAQVLQPGSNPVWIGSYSHEIQLEDGKRLPLRPCDAKIPRGASPCPLILLCARPTIACNEKECIRKCE